MDRIKIITLIFALSFCAANSYACYDDDDDDWSQYDEYDYDDCDDEDDDDDDPNAFYYNDGSILMDEVVVTAPAPRSDEEDDEEDDDDWWRRYENNNSSDEDDGYGYDGDEDCYIRGGGTDSSNNSNNGEKDDKGIYRIKCKDGTIIINIEKCEAYILSDKDKLIVDKLNIPVNYVQFNPASTCFIAGLSLAEMILSGIHTDYESLIVNKYGQNYNYNDILKVTSGEVGVSVDMMMKLLGLMYGLDTDYSHCAFIYNSVGFAPHALILSGLSSSVFDSFLDKNYLIMTDIYADENKTNHNVDIYGKTDDGRYLCYDTITGKTIALEYSDFIKSYIVIIKGSNQNAFK